ncbi:MAG: hypothetical protein KY455_08080 [Euryarchaeota archaeon]|nr:hypothetical protein [Euryarchaeota archaeon]
MRPVLWVTLGVLVLTGPTPGIGAQPGLSTEPAKGFVDLEIKDPVVFFHTPEKEVRFEVFGRIQCTDGARPPRPVFVANGFSTSGTESFSVDATERQIDWRPDPSATAGGWMVKASSSFNLTTTIDREEGRTTTSDKVILVRDGSGDDGCTADGYRWHGDRDLFTAIVPQLDNGTTNGTTMDKAGPFSLPDAGLGFLVGLAVGGLAVWVLLLRRR